MRCYRRHCFWHIWTHNAYLMQPCAQPDGYMWGLVHKRSAVDKLVWSLTMSDNLMQRFVLQDATLVTVQWLWWFLVYVKSGVAPETCLFSICEELYIGYWWQQPIFVGVMVKWQQTDRAFASSASQQNCTDVSRTSPWFNNLRFESASSLSSYQHSWKHLGLFWEKRINMVFVWIPTAGSIPQAG